MSWKLRVLEYGKIESAEIEMAPLTFFVGDNNSGKSYLMSLLWGIQNLGAEVLIGREMEFDTEAEKLLFFWVNEQVKIAREHGTNTVRVCEIINELQVVLQERLKRNKNDIVKTIFNSSDVRINELQIQLMELEEVSLRFSYDTMDDWIYLSLMVEDHGIIKRTRRLQNDQETNEVSKSIIWFLVKGIYSILMNIRHGGGEESNRSIYLPATRTGFMLTKDIINKMSRKTVFNIEMDQDELAPFTRPVNQFLDVINDLTLDNKGSEAFEKVVEYLESDMADGTVEMSILPNKEVSYVPNGRKEGIPLRIVSAVVTELSPLIIILKHKCQLDTLFYEEPEMCLHPQLQQKMARVICQLVNAGLHMVVTTHSDIILQHINNMIRLFGREDMEDICQQLGYEADDVLNRNKVKVYQLKTQAGGTTKVEELMCGENGYKIPTFNDALDEIMDEAYAIQE